MPNHCEYYTSQPPDPVYFCSQTFIDIQNGCVITQYSAAGFPYESARRLDWDDADDEQGDTAHIAEHGLTAEKVESVLFDTDTMFDVSESSGRPIAFGYTGTGRFIAIVFELLNLDDPLILRPITAYEVPEPTE